MPSWTNDIVSLLATSCGAGVGDCHDRTAYNAEIDKDCLNLVSFENVLLGAVFNSGEKRRAAYRVSGSPPTAILITRYTRRAAT